MTSIITSMTKYFKDNLATSILRSCINCYKDHRQSLGIYVSDKCIEMERYTEVGYSIRRQSYSHFFLSYSPSVEKPDGSRISSSVFTKCNVMSHSIRSIDFFKSNSRKMALVKITGTRHFYSLAEGCGSRLLHCLFIHLGLVFTNHSQEHSSSFSARFPIRNETQLPIG